MEFKDYYKTFGVERGAEEEIRKASRRLGAQIPPSGA
jgi:DnaJ-class molecular chaperone